MRFITDFSNCRHVYSSYSLYASRHRTRKSFYQWNIVLIGHLILSVPSRQYFQHQPPLPPTRSRSAGYLHDSLCIKEAPVTNSIRTLSDVTVLTPTRTDISKNTVITTTDDKGRPTVVPVIICPNCGPNIVLILYKLPPLPNIGFRLPGFPKLPRFHVS